MTARDEQGPPLTNLADQGPLPPTSQALVALGTALRDCGYRFVTPTPLTVARNNGRPANAWARSLTDVFGWSRPFEARTIPPTLLDIMTAAEVVTPAGEGFRSTVRVSTLGELLFLHSAYPTTARDAVFFGPDTYRFTHAIRAHLAACGPLARVADIGCGAGPGGIVIAAAQPGAEVLMLDINQAALRLAGVNAALNGTANASAHHSDILAGASGSFDLIVSNPPYLIDAGARGYRHGGGALGEGLSVKILQAALPRLRPGGTLLLYTGSAIVEGVDGFRAAAEAVLQPTGRSWSYAEVDPDVFGEELESGMYAGTDRIAAVVLMVP